MTADVHIDRLTLKLQGISKLDGQRLAALVSEGLSRANIAGSRAMVRAEVQMPSAGGVEALSQSIVAEVLRQLARST